MTTLYIDASDHHRDPASGHFSASIASDFGDKIIVRRVTDELNFHADIWAEASFTAPEERSAAQREAVELTQDMLSEFIAADRIVLSATLRGFTLPPALTAWLDLVACAHDYAEDDGFDQKRVVAVTGSSGTRIDSQLEFAGPVLRSKLDFLDLINVDIIPVTPTTTPALATNAMIEPCQLTQRASVAMLSS